MLHLGYVLKRMHSNSTVEMFQFLISLKFMCFSWEAPLVPMCHFWGPYALPDRSGNHGVCMIHFIQRHSTVEMSDFFISLKLKRFSWEAPLVPMSHFWGPYTHCQTGPAARTLR